MDVFSVMVGFVAGALAWGAFVVIGLILFGAFARVDMSKNEEESLVVREACDIVYNTEQGWRA